MTFAGKVVAVTGAASSIGRATALSFGPQGAQVAARHMMPRRQGRIVNIASVAGAVPRMHGGAYCVSNAGVRMFTKCLALELARYGITVNAVSPGSTDTPMLGVATEGTEEASDISGQCLYVDGLQSQC